MVREPVLVVIVEARRARCGLLAKTVEGICIFTVCLWRPGSRWISISVETRPKAEVAPRGRLCNSEEVSSVCSSSLEPQRWQRSFQTQALLAVDGQKINGSGWRFGSFRLWIGFRLLELLLRMFVMFCKLRNFVSLHPTFMTE